MEAQDTAQVAVGRFIKGSLHELAIWRNNGLSQQWRARLLYLRASMWPKGGPTSEVFAYSAAASQADGSEMPAGKSAVDPIGREPGARCSGFGPVSMASGVMDTVGTATGKEPCTYHPSRRGRLYEEDTISTPSHVSCPPNAFEDALHVRRCCLQILTKRYSS